MEKPNPGSKEAVEQGCTCPIVDNHYGAGVVMKEGEKPAFWYRSTCPMHGNELQNESRPR